MAQQPFMFNPNPAGGYRSAKEDLQLAEILAPYGAEEKSIASQLEQARALRDTESPAGLNPTGRIFTKASPLEFAGAFAKKAAGQYGVSGAHEKTAAMTKRLAAEMKRKIEEMEAREQERQQQRNQALTASASAESALPATFGMPLPLPEMPPVVDPVGSLEGGPY